MMERDLVRDILAAWGAHPSVRMARVNTGAAMLGGRLVRFGVPGTADIVGIIAPAGRLLMVEAKSKTGKMRDAQRAMQRMIIGMGGVYIVARELADVDAVLTAMVGKR